MMCRNGRLWRCFERSWKSSERKGQVALGAEGIAEAYRFISEVCPFFFVMDRWIEKQSKEKLQERRKAQEKTIEKALAQWGF